MREVKISAVAHSGIEFPSSIVGLINAWEKQGAVPKAVLRDTDGFSALRHHPDPPQTGRDRSRTPANEKSLIRRARALNLTYSLDDYGTFILK